jgi:predicted MFS family arabinose efflux permease
VNTLARGAPRGVLTLLAIAAFCSGAALRICDGLLPRIAHDFTITPGMAGHAIFSFSVGYGLSQLVFGPMGDQFGKIRMMTIALYGCAVSALVSACVQDFGVLVAVRALWGVAAAGIVPLAMAWIGDNVPYTERQAILGRFLLGTLSGMTAGQLSGGLFGQAGLGWRGAFMVLAAGFAVVGTVLALYPHQPHATSREEATEGRGFESQLRSVLRDPWARIVLLAVLGEGIFLLGPLSYLPSMLRARHGLGLGMASGLLAMYAVGGLIYAASARRVVAGLGELRMVCIGGALMGACFLAWWMWPPWLLAAPIALVLGFGTYLLHNTLQTHATQMAPAVRGTAVSLFSFSLFSGQAIGTLLAGWVIDHLGYAPMLAAAGLALPLTATAFAVQLRRRMGSQLIEHHRRQ